MANLLRRDRRLRGKDTSLPPPSQRYPRKNMLPPLEPNEQAKPKENSLYPSPDPSLLKPQDTEK